MSKGNSRAAPEPIRNMRIRDVIFISAVIFIAGVIVLSVYLFSGDGAYIEIYTENRLYGTYMLNNDAIIDVNGKNTVEISGGSASVTTSDCPQGICVAHAPVSRNGESIVCLPNRMTVIVRGGGEPETDAVAGR